MFHTKIACGLAALAVTAGAASAQPAKPAPANRTLPSGDCFDSRDWQGWASPSPDLLYIRVRQKDVYRIDLAPGRSLNSPSDFLVTISRGSSRVCGVIDLDLKVSDRIGPATPLFPLGITKLTPAEAAALPKGSKP